MGLASLKMHMDAEDKFSLTAKAYQYGSDGGRHGIYVSTKENRKRVFIPLETDKPGVICIPKMPPVPKAGINNK